MNELNEEVYAFDQEVTLESRRKLLDTESKSGPDIITIRKN